MSEMIKYKDRSITLGTCQNLYYATYADLKNNVEHFTKISSLSVEGYLNEKYGFRYRFPFADEKPNIGNYAPFNRGFMVKISRRLLKDTAKQIFHNRVFTRNDEVPGFSYGFFNPCPVVKCDEVEIMDWSNLRNYLIFEITQQMQFNGQLVTVVRCPFCQNVSRFGVDDWTEINTIIQDPANEYDELTRENSARAMAGYLTKL